MDAPARKLVLIDGSSYLYRAFHALPPLANSRGEPTGAVLGVLNMLQKLLKEEDPQLVAVVFDAPGRTFRDDLFEQYKANRPPMPDELRSQVQPLLDAVTALGLPLLRIPGVEADDVIGTLARRAAEAGLDVLISTGDKDMAQLVDGHVTLVNTMTGSVLDRAGVKAKFDVYPEQIVDYLALVGDSSDNIPGVPKVGPKTAAKWLNEFGSVAGLLQRLGEIPGKVGESLKENLAQLELSQRLATINCALTLDRAPDELHRKPPDVPTLRDLYSRLELRLLLKQLTGDDVADAPADKVQESAGGSPDRRLKGNYTAVLSAQDLDRWLQRIRAAGFLAFDTETTSLDYMNAEIVGVSFSVEPGEAAYIPLAHDYAGAPAQLDRAKTLAALQPVLEDEGIGKVGHHLKYDAHVLLNHGIRLRGMQFDTMLESYVLDSTAVRHDMDSVARKYLGVETIHYEDVTGKGAKQIGFSQVAIEQATSYAAEDADVTLSLHRSLWPQLESVPSLRDLYRTIEQPLVPVLLEMEHAGVLVDKDMLKRQSSELAVAMLDLQAAAHAAAGGTFNIESPKQLQEILFGKLGIPVLRKTPTGQPSTAEDVLEELSEAHELPRLVLQYRSLSKLKSTYTDKLPGQVNARTGRVHTSYHQAIAATGRLSSTDPNLQNIPIRTPEGRRIRQAFIAPPGRVLVAADYSQIELRIMAHLSRDNGLLQAFADDRDVHRATAAEVFATPLAEVTPDQRRSAKAINFGLIYGMSAFGLAKQLGIGRGDAQKYVDLYFERYPGVKRYMDETRQAARDRGYVETVFGRRLHLPDIQSRNSALRQYAERSAINAPMQGTAADIIKLAMIDIASWLRDDSGARLIMQVHDELVFEVASDRVDAVVEGVRERMSGAARLDVPLKVDIGIGGNWDEAH
jgi:DNA polymerase-1